MNDHLKLNELIWVIIANEPIDIVKTYFDENFY